MRTSTKLALLALACVSTSACSSDVGAGVRRAVARAVPAAYTDAGLGFDPGLAPTAPLAEVALAGASIPRAGGGGDLLLALVAFSTAAAADDGDGAGTPLDRSSPAPVDSNGMPDVFLAAVINTERQIDGKPQPAAFVQGIASVMRDPRCVTCHSFHYPGGFRERGHNAKVPAGRNDGCAECHSTQETLLPGIAPPRIVWIAPDPLQRAQPTQDFRGKTDRQLFDLARGESDPKEHLQQDDKILWALAHAQIPFRGLVDGGRVPMDPEQWNDLVEAWALNGSFWFSTDQAVRDIVLVSQVPAGGASNGSSDAPSLAFEPNPLYSPTNPPAAPAGWVHVAFTSDARDLVAGATTTHRDVYRARVAVRLDANLDVDLVADPSATELVSRSTAGARGGNGDSEAPTLSFDASLASFTSKATDLVAGFVDGNGPDGTDVFVRNLGPATTVLASRSFAGAALGGNGASRSASLSATGGVVAFESLASDLVSRDDNRVADVFYAVDRGAGLQVTRASLVRGGGEMTGGAASAPSVWVVPNSGDVVVAFTASGTNLDASPVAGVFVHHSSGDAPTRISGNLAVPMQRPVISPDGSRVLFVSAASDLDPRRIDANGVADVFAVDLSTLLATAAVSRSRLSLAVTGADADGASSQARVASFRNFAGNPQSDVLVGFATEASNIGKAPNSPHVLQFAVDRTTPRTTAEFNAIPRAGTAPFAVQFTDLSSNASTWAWDFGDGAMSPAQNPTHTYVTPGTYDVELRVTGAGGNATARKPQFITVRAAPPTWSEIYMAYFTACSNCHTGPRNTSTFAMAPQGTAYGNLVGIASIVCGGRTRVVAGNATTSQIVDTLSGIGCHPNHTGGTRSEQVLVDLRAWINAGALDN